MDNNEFRTVRMDKDSIADFIKKDVKKNDVERIRKYGSFLIVISGPEEGKVFYINKPNLIIGREDEVDIKIKESYISRKHAQIISQRHAKLISAGNEVILIDLQSTNGTFVNGKRIKEVTLRDGDEIRIGNVIMKFFQEEIESPYDDKTSFSDKNVVTDFYKRVFQECELYFGGRTKKFLDRQINAHLGKTPQTIDYRDKSELAKWIGISASLFIDEKSGKELAEKIRSL
ncbi:MAG: FHA domain-containing protein [Candidatus Omnitrophica bacterium]|nr:FHA domain-containing protein [Candidatus Omnitrophota bacterium]